MGKNVMIPLTLLEQTIVLLEHWDVSDYELYVRCDYHNILDSLIWKRQKLELRDTYSKIVQADSQEQTREAIRKQLQYIRRDIGYIVRFVQDGIRLTSGQKEHMNLLTMVYEQQRIMYEANTHSVHDRIVSLSQPYVRPIPRGKAKAKTEFGAKLHISMVDGYARIERLSFDAYNEAEDFFHIVEGYRRRCGRYPARILADRIYRNRETLSFCKENGIRLTGPALGCPPKDASLSKSAKRQEYADICDRNAVEGEFGTVKTAYGLSRVAARLEDTSRLNNIQSNRSEQRPACDIGEPAAPSVFGFMTLAPEQARYLGQSGRHREDYHTLTRISISVILLCCEKMLLTV